MEIWKPIKEYEGLYEVSNYGRVKSLGNNKYKKEKMLKPITTNGYKRVKLSKNGEQKKYLIHRLVAEAFLDNPDNLPQVNHKDENKLNNNVNNLEWCDSKYNMNYGTRNERQSKAMKGKKLSDEHKRKISEAKKGRVTRKVQCLNTGETFKSVQEAARKYNVDQSHISKCCKGKRKSAGKSPVTKEKLIWKYLE